LLVLIADDNADGRQLLADIINSIDLRVIEASDGPTAIALAQAHLPDLIILDVNMPGMSGFEVCARLKSDAVTAQTPIIMLTALSDIDYRVQGLRLGADDYLSKPFNSRELVERIKARLRSKVETDALRKRQQAIRDTFERYVAPAVVEQLLREPEEVRLGGTLQEITVLFADLEGFTSLSERIEPEALLAILNAYHTMIVSLIREHGGTIDKFMGDGVMALYNTPLAQPDHALRAVETALHIRSVLARFHQQFAPERRMNLNFGIHSGRAVVGNVGAPDIMNYTAVGDTVNLAARLQALSSGGQILISSATQALIAGRIEARLLGQLKVKGRSETVQAYEVLGTFASRGVKSE